jgi:ectoine hydroxylase-related dioxygenase (phytanoyl-CoA dioxygenase family)
VATQPTAPRAEAEIEHYAELLLEDGYVIIHRAEDSEIVRALDADLRDSFEKTPFSRGNFFGNRTVRFGRALLRSRYSAALVQNPLVLRVCERVLLPWCESIQLNLTQAIAVHPGAPAQLPHRDQDMWGGPKGGGMEYMVNVIWPLTRFTRENGATLVWKGSHRIEADDYIDDETMVAALMEPGSALLFLGSALHGQGANETDEVRRALAIGYSLSWLKPYENQMLSYPPEIARHFPGELAELVGYRQVPPNLNNFEGQSPMRLLDDEVPEHFGAVDAFRPDQIEAIDYYFANRKPRLV